ncbi:Fanconi anemia core complex-associated protein 24 [Spea bombifrons]|uniref:Fanconi anemia core complex-associated protein 24 n=1 Tax=Spea bombifrons TaxID=233779 RepID=UPI00234AD4E7|nr:Fanconi anemia core complex-associated protein 24 [Spea bombifrons]
MSATQGTPVRVGASVVPYGHIIASEKWRGTELSHHLQGKITLVFEDGLGLVDFHLSSRTCALYVSEADIIAGSTFKRRIVRFREACNLKGIIIIEKTRLSDQYYPPIQNFVALELGMTILPVTDQSEAAQLIAHLVHERSNERSSNPFCGGRQFQASEANILQTVQTIPGVGKVKALQLLQRFPSLQRLSAASVSQLEAIVGRSTASRIHAFFTQT